MTFTEIYNRYINNNYFPIELLENAIPKMFTDNIKCQETFAFVKELYKKNNLTKLNESQLEEEFIKPILTQIFGYSFITQDTITVQGKLLKPDYLLFDNDDNKSKYLKDKNLDHVRSIFEAKAWGIDLDGKIIKDSPHAQLVQYNLFMNIPYGLLSNGQKWRFYDLRERKSEKIYYEIDLEKIIQDDNYLAFKYFYYIFRKEYFIPIKDLSPADTMVKAKERFIEQMEVDLKEVIYGRNSIIEKIGRALIKSYPDKDLKDLFDHAVVMAYRLLFVAYFETQFKSYLFGNHDHYKSVALLTLYDKLKNDTPIKAYQELTNLFDTLDKGSVPFKIPLLNGGLFDLEKAPLFEYSKNRDLFSNEDIKEILVELLQKSDDSLGIRNFSMMSVTHIGNVYEGLLQYTFRMADDTMYYIEYYDKKEAQSGYFDEYDYQALAKRSNVAIMDSEKISKNTLYLVNRSNSRKISASYYTPQTLSKFMVSDAVDTILKTEKFQKDILSVRIIDNACGSGHFLVDVLDELTEKIYAHIEDFDYLQIQITEEKTKITDNLETYNLEHLEIDELQILKRLLLKKVIYGVDLQEFAVELTRLSLWLKTFIFGTPLSFIEHHIKQGNALIGSSIDEGKQIFNQFSATGLFASNFEDKFIALGKVAETLANLQDSTSKDVEQSKHIYQHDIEPKQKDLARILDLITYHNMKLACKKNKDIEVFSTDTDNLFHRMDEAIYQAKDTQAIDEIKRVSDKYHFFHYDIAFPEMYGRAFDIVLGNPPWDKVKFDEKDFFPQYRSNYRSMSVSQKESLRDNLLTSPSYEYIQNDYNDTATITNTVSAYYKAHYPLNNGSGHPNLFRLFMEKNTSLLEKGGRLIYVTPSAWSYEESSLQIRKKIIDEYQFNYFYQFENKGIFPDVDDRYKFAIWSISNISKRNKVVPSFFMENDTNRLYNKEILDLSYPLSISRSLFPNSYIILEINDDKAFSIIDKMYSVGKAIDPNYIDFRNELHMTNDNDLFLEIKTGESLFPLYEGKMIHQFNPNFATANYWVDPEALRERLLSKEISRMVDNIYEQLPKITDNTGKTVNKIKSVLSHLNLVKREDLAPFVRYDFEYPRLGFRAISANTNENTLISSIVSSHTTAGNSLWVSAPKQYVLENKSVIVKEFGQERMWWVNACFNSIAMDYILRFLVDINVNKIYLMQLPLIHASDEELETPPYKEIWQNALALTCYHEPSFCDHPLAKGLTIPKTEKARDLLQIANDILIAKLYGITGEEMSSILDTFKVLNNKRPMFVETLRSMAMRDL